MLVHKGCGGVVKEKDRTCKRCGKVWNRLAYMLQLDIEEKIEERFSSKKYRKRIRNGKDIC